jgi:hypothetical protein
VVKPKFAYMNEFFQSMIQTCDEFSKHELVIKAYILECAYDALPILLAQQSSTCNASQGSYEIRVFDFEESERNKKRKKVYCL